MHGHSTTSSYISFWTNLMHLWLQLHKKNKFYIYSQCRYLLILMFIILNITLSSLNLQKEKKKGRERRGKRGEMKEGRDRSYGMGWTSRRNRGGFKPSHLLLIPPFLWFRWGQVAWNKSSLPSSLFSLIWTKGLLTS